MDNKIENIKNQIVDRLKSINPELIILFGSYAYGTPNENSDLDFFLVTKDEFIPDSLNKMIELKLSVSKLVREYQKQIPIDIITHTKPMSEKFKESQNYLYNDIFNRGVVLYEKRNWMDKSSRNGFLSTNLFLKNIIQQIIHEVGA